MGYDPTTTKTYTPEEREALDKRLAEATGEELEILKKQIANIEDISQEEYQELERHIPGSDRRAWWAGRVFGKDRKKSRTSKMSKKQKNRRDREARKATKT